MLESGTKAPDFELPDQNGEMHKLSDYAGKKVILYFYPKDNTPGCTKQACGFSERYPQFTEKGAVILGVSKDSVASHKRFEEKYGLAFTLLADPERKVIEAYDVWKEKKNYGKVSIGADLCAKQEAEDFLKEVPDELPFMATSCCPAWSVMAKKLFPEHAKCISMALTPMTLTARLIKQHNPDARVVFIGPCAAKKLEAMRRSVRSEVDFVLTFEEMTGIFSAKHVDLENIEEDPAGVSDASTDGRNFAVAGGVAQAVVNVIKRDHPDQEVKVANAEGLKECRQLLKLATLGKYPGYLLEGMACPGGCVAGAGTMQAIKKSQTSVGLYAKQSTHKTSSETEYIKELDKLVD